MNSMKIALSCLVILILLPLRAADLDFDVVNYADKNGNLDKTARLRLFSAIQKRRFLQNAKSTDFDLDSNLTLMAQKYIKDISDEDECQLETDAQDHDGKSLNEMPVDDMVSYLKGDLYGSNDSLARGFKVKQGLNTAGFELRHSFNTDLADITDVGDVTAPSQATKTDFAKGALFSYTRDFSSNHDTWTADGAILRPINIVDEKKKPKDAGEMWLSKVDFVPSITFDKLTTNDPKTTKIDSLVFRAGTVVEFFGGGVFDLMQVRGYVGNGTDFEFRSQVFTTELEWEPIKLSASLGKYTRLGPIPIYYATRFYLHAEYTDVLDTGDKANLTEGSAGRFGPRVGLDMQVVGLPQLTLSCFYAYDTPLTNDIDGSQYYSFALNYDITENFGLTAQYKYGQIPIARDKADTFNAGLTIKF